jgi:glucan phosphoethanolaminetransferase (alkaline phosphatase superfamily)
VSLLLATVRVVVWLGLPVLSSSASALTTAGFIMWPTFGLLFNVVWASLCWVTVRHEKAALCKWITGLMPVSLIYFIAAFVAGQTSALSPKFRYAFSSHISSYVSLFPKSKWQFTDKSIARIMINACSNP